MSPKRSPQWSKKSSPVTVGTKSRVKNKPAKVNRPVGRAESTSPQEVGFGVEASGPNESQELKVESKEVKEESSVPVAWQENVAAKPVVIDKNDSSERVEVAADRVVFGLGILFWLLVAVGTGLTLYYYSSGKWAIEKVVAGQAVTTPTPTPTKTVIAKDTRIQVLNASGVSGAAGKLKKYLEDQGYENVEVGNADETQTNNQVNLPKTREMSPDLTNVLSDYGLVKIEFGVSESETVEILIGSE